jgi:hypothetical protein
MAIEFRRCSDQGDPPCGPCGCQYFPGFLNPNNHYKTYTFYDLDNCIPNGIVSATFNNECKPIVTQSTQDYATIIPVGSEWYGYGSFEHIDSDTYTWFQAEQSCGDFRIYSILSNKV